MKAGNNDKKWNEAWIVKMKWRQWSRKRRKWLAKPESAGVVIGRKRRRRKMPAKKSAAIETQWKSKNKYEKAAIISNEENQQSKRKYQQMKMAVKKLMKTENVENEEKCLKAEKGKLQWQWKNEKWRNINEEEEEMASSVRRNKHLAKAASIERKNWRKQWRRGGNKRCNISCNGQPAVSMKIINESWKALPAWKRLAAKPRKRRKAEAKKRQASKPATS